MKRSVIQAASRRTLQARASRLWPGAAVAVLPLVFVLDCAVTGCGNSSDDSTPTPGNASTSPPNLMDNATANGGGNGGPMTVTEPNQPASNEGMAPVSLQNPGSTNNGTAGRNRADAGPPSTAPIDPALSGLVPCGAAGRFCEKPNLTCCTPGGGAGQGANAATCQASADACPMGTLSSAACSSAASCDGAQVCCRTPNAAPAGGMGMAAGGGNNGTTTSCAASCAAGAAQVCLTDEECGTGFTCGNNGTCVAAPCTGAAGECATGEICCRGGGGGAATGTCVAPAAAGACPNPGQRQLCTVDADCGAGNTCAPLAQGGGGVAAGGGGAAALRACAVAPCTPGSCATGQLCCVGGGGGGGGGAPACAAANMAGACPGNSRLFCATDDDCAGAAGTACLTGPNGAGGLSCRLPPAPPPAAADAGAGG